MIELSFSMGEGVAIRHVTINGKNVMLISHETGFEPININIDKLKQHMPKIKMQDKDVQKDIKEASELQTEEAIADDITKDFEKSGWRLIKRHNGST